MRPLWKLALTALIVALALAACGKDKQAEPEPSPTATPSPSPTPAIETPEPASPTPAFVAPLTGMPVEQPPSFRPFTVMINNYAAARPQSGLTYADVVWEVLAEGGITRLMAVFHSREFSDPIGPIRSIRPYLIDLGEMYGGVLVHAGASNDALAILQHSGKADLDEIYNAGAFFYRDKSRKAPHNLYSTLEMLREGVRKRKFPEQVPVPGLPFSAEAPPGAANAVNIEARFTLKNYVVSYTYDTGTGLYTRAINGEIQIDLNNNEPLTAANLVFLRTAHRVLDKEGRLEIDLQSGGEALLFRGGKVVSAEWTREKGDIIRIRKDGAELPFAPGVTYYHVIPGPLDEHVTFS